MRPFSTFHADLNDQEIRTAEAARLRTLATWAYLLLRPGMEFVRQRSNFILGWEQAAAARGGALDSGVSAGAVGAEGVPALGSWMILPHLTGPATQTVLPSNDALYGAAHVELDAVGPVVLTVPGNLDQRYFSVAVMDAHMNNVAHIGPRWTGNEPTLHLVVPPGWEGPCPQGMHLVASPTGSICLYNRMLVRYDDDGLAAVQRWQAGLRITELSSWGQPQPVHTPVDTHRLVHPDLNGLTDPFAYLEIGLEHLRNNPLAREADWLTHLIGDAGFQGARLDPELADAVSAGVDDATAMLDATLTTWPRSGGWMLPDPTLGLPNPQVLKAAAFQQFQIGSNDIAESAYYFADTDSEGEFLDASGEAVYELSFNAGQQPPLNEGGYWSLTMYNEASRLVDNPINRYSTRPDRPGLEIGPDGALRIGLSVEQGTCPAANWLPAPEGRFRLGLRVYYPGAGIVTGTWQPPAVRRLR